VRRGIVNNGAMLKVIGSSARQAVKLKSSRIVAIGIASDPMPPSSIVCVINERMARGYSGSELMT
jgi:hypothetical protein